MDPYIGEIRMLGCNFPPIGWLPCDGRTLSIAENDTLFAVIGNAYGGDGQTTFNLPDLRGRAPMHRQLGSYAIGATGGTESVTLTSPQLPTHTHLVSASNQQGNTNSPQNAFFASPVPPTQASPPSLYTTKVDGTMSPQAVSVVGGNQPHDNMMPFSTVNFVIAIQGIFPVSS